MKTKKGLFLLSILLTSCSAHIYEGDFYFSEKYYQEEGKLIYDEDYSLISLALENKESFGVYIFLSGCPTCNSFKPYVEEFLNEYQICMYSVNYQIMKYKEDGYHQLIKYAPSVMLFKEGELVDYLDPNDNKDTKYYKSKDKFASWVSKYVKLESQEETTN